MEHVLALESGGGEHIQTSACLVDTSIKEIFRVLSSDSKTFDFDLDTAMEVFNTLAADATQRWELLPYLSLCTTILATHGRVTELIALLHRCCTELQQHDNIGAAKEIGPFYGYVLANMIQDDTLIAHYGHQLPRITVSINERLSRAHPAALSSRNFEIWHRLYTQSSDPTRVYDELRENIADSVRQLRGGSGNLLVVNAMAILGRCLQESGCYVEASAVLQTAVRQLDPMSQLLHSYREGLLLRLQDVRAHL